MTNPQATMRMLITYVICIAVAILVGYLLTNPLDYGTLGFLGIILALLISPVFIKWHYPIMVFALSSPFVMFFLKGSPPFSQFMVMASLGIAVVERTINSDRRFISLPSLIWPLVFTFGMIAVTAKLTGGIGFHSLGSGEGDVVGGGKKYIALFVGIATFFALTSRPIPVARRNFYLALFLLPAILVFFSDLISYLPYPFKYIGLLVPGSIYLQDPDSMMDMGPRIKRFAGLASLASALLTYLLARYGLREILWGGRLWRLALFIVLPFLVMAGGFRSVLVQLIMMIGILFLMEGLHRTRLIVPVILGSCLAAALVLPFAGALPLSLQRSLAFLPLPNLDSQVVMDADASSEWRYQIWGAVWPKVPEYLLLGKGYGLTKDDYSMIGSGTFARANASHIDFAEATLAISSDFHNGPLSVLIPFGVWGAIAFLWFTLAGLRVLYRNYRYSPPELKTINRYLLVAAGIHWFAFFAIFGSFPQDVGYFATYFGLSVAFNGGLRGPAAQPAAQPVGQPVKPALAARGAS